MHQPLEDYIPPATTQYAGMAIGAAALYILGSAIGDGGHFGLLAAALLGVPGGWIGSFVYHYVALAPVREDDRRRAVEYDVQRQWEIVEREEMDRLRVEDPAEWHRRATAHSKEMIRRGQERRVRKQAESQARFEKQRARRESGGFLQSLDRWLG